MAAAFNFDGFQIKDLVYKLDEKTEKTTTSREIDFQISVSSNKDDANKFRIELITNVKGNPEIELSLFGFLISTGYFESGEAIESAKVVGASILYPYARSIISSITVQDSTQGVILPTINLLELFSENNPYEKKNNGSSDDEKIK